MDFSLDDAFGDLKPAAATAPNGVDLDYDLLGLGSPIASGTPATPLGDDLMFSFDAPASLASPDIASKGSVSASAPAGDEKPAPPARRGRALPPVPAAAVPVVELPKPKGVKSGKRRKRAKVKKGAWKNATIKPGSPGADELRKAVLGDGAGAAVQTASETPAPVENTVGIWRGRGRLKWGWESGLKPRWDGWRGRKKPCMRAGGGRK